jgi:AraC-like DNA-binding protein
VASLIASTNDRFAPVRFALDEFAEAERAAIFCEQYGRTMLKLAMEPLPGHPLQFAGTVHALPGLGLVSGVISPVHTRHDVRHIEADDLILHVMLAGGRTLRQIGREAVATDGEALLCSASEVGLSTVYKRSKFVALRMPRSIVAPKVHDLDAAVARSYSANSTALRLLASYVGVVHDMTDTATSGLRQSVVSHLCDLAALVLGATRDAAEAARTGGVRAARLRAIKSDILANLASSISVNAVARRHNISTRYIRKLFEAAGTTFSDFVLDQRLAHVHRMLSDPRFAARSISAIALESGFGDVSYFNRVFRRCFGATPSDVRQAARLASEGVR